jgi:hypothetical protein
MNTAVVKDLIAVIRTERDRRITTLEDEHPDYPADRWLFTDEPFLNELGLVLLVAIRHQLERELIRLAARVTDDRHEMSGDEYRQRIEDERERLRTDGWKFLIARLRLQAFPEWTSRELDGAFARLVSGEIGFECRDRIAAHRVKRTMARRRFEAGNELPIQAECRHPVADALLRAGCGSMDSATHLLERYPVFRRQAGQIFVDCLRLRCHEYSPCGRQVVGQKTSLSSISRKHSAAVSPRKTVNHLPV